ncbi:MAG: hypothetical protein ACREH6_07485 [Geminicoccaceae bacterium]
MLAPRRKRTGAEFWQALRGDGPFLEDNDEFFKIMEDLDQPVEPPDFSE